ncbi:hypothetical protein [Streptomyces sp. NPDC096033]|uniref:hypothetical protein n=1 Tax=Streptomyces sp. NPDC096033 TaxID=3366071 RepID=UPI00382B7075
MARWYEQDGVNAGWTVGTASDGTPTRWRVRLDWIDQLPDEDRAALSQEAGRRGMSFDDYAGRLAHMPSAEFKSHTASFGGDLRWAAQQLRTTVIERQTLLGRPGLPAAWLGD